MLFKPEAKLERPPGTIGQYSQGEKPKANKTAAAATTTSTQGGLLQVRACTGWIPLQLVPPPFQAPSAKQEQHPVSSCITPTIANAIQVA